MREPRRCDVVQFDLPERPGVRSVENLVVAPPRWVPFAVRLVAIRRLRLQRRTVRSPVSYHDARLSIHVFESTAYFRIRADAAETLQEL